MNCQEAEMYVSVMHDGETVPFEFRDHFDVCGVCQERLQNYLEMGSELRQMASRAALGEEAPMPRFAHLEAKRARSFWTFLAGKMRVPRFAMLLLASAFVAVSAGLALVHAQNPARPLWFQFELDSSASHDSSDPGGRQDVAQAGYDEVSMQFSETGIVAMHVAVFAIRQDSVELGIRARRVSADDARSLKIRERLGNLASHPYSYSPGQRLAVPVEGGGTLELQGRIADRQPELAFGYPLKPRLDELVLASPVLISGKTVEANLTGANARATSGVPYSLVRLYDPDAGLFVFSLNPLPGAVEGRAEWGKLDFNVEGQSYSLLCAAPITGGGQPRSVWVKRVKNYKPEDQNIARGFLGVWNPSVP